MRRDILLIIVLLLLSNHLLAIHPFYKLGEVDTGINELTIKITQALKDNHFEVLGMYHPANNEDLCVIVFTCDELTSIATSAVDKGAFGATLRVGLYRQNDKTVFTILNPKYMCYAYFNKDANRDEIEKMTHKINAMVLRAFKDISTELTPYGSELTKKELKDYHFSMFMPDFDDVIDLYDFDDFESAVESMKHNLLKNDSTINFVYELIFSDKEIAVFGIGLMDNEGGDAQTIDISGVGAIASLPYEILIQGNKAYMLNVKYRIPLYNSGLGLSRIFKIQEISSDVKNFFENIANVPEIED